MDSTDPALGTVYLIHFDPAYNHARHYTGWTTDLPARLDAHRHGRGARLMEVITDAGIAWQLARTWPGGRNRERAIKNRHNAPQLCPLCTPRPLPAESGRSALIITTPAPALVLPSPVPVSPHQQGLRHAEQFLAQRTGWPPAQLTTALAYITGPYLQDGPHTPAQDEAFAVFTQTVTTAIAQLAAPDSDHAFGEHQ